MVWCRSVNLQILLSQYPHRHHHSRLAIHQTSPFISTMIRLGVSNRYPYSARKNHLTSPRALSIQQVTAKRTNSVQVVSNAKQWAMENTLKASSLSQDRLSRVKRSNLSQSSFNSLNSRWLALSPLSKHHRNHMMAIVLSSLNYKQKLSHSFRARSQESHQVQELWLRIQIGSLSWQAQQNSPHTFHPYQHRRITKGK